MSEPIKYLNLEDLQTPSTRALRFKGVDHPILEQTVDTFIRSQLLIKGMSNEGGEEGQDVSEMVINTVDLILISVPTLPKSGLMGMPLSALNTILTFIQSGDEGTQGSEEVQTETSKK